MGVMERLGNTCTYLELARGGVIDWCELENGAEWEQQLSDLAVSMAGVRCDVCLGDKGCDKAFGQLSDERWLDRQTGIETETRERGREIESSQDRARALRESVCVCVCA